MIFKHCAFRNVAFYRDDDTVDVPEFSDYDGDYGSSQQDYGITSNYSTLMSNSGQGVKVKEIQVDQEEIKKIDDVDTGAALKGEHSMVIQTELIF